MNTRQVACGPRSSNHQCSQRYLNRIAERTRADGAADGRASFCCLRFKSKSRHRSSITQRLAGRSAIRATSTKLSAAGVGRRNPNTLAKSPNASPRTPRACADCSGPSAADREIRPVAPSHSATPLAPETPTAARPRAADVVLQTGGSRGPNHTAANSSRPW